MTLCKYYRTHNALRSAEPLSRQRRWLPCVLYALGSTVAQAEEISPQPTVLAPILVQGISIDPSLISPDARTADALMRRIPGNVSVVDSEQYRDAAVMSLRDALARTPGVYVQNTAGQETVKLSIRGSGVSAKVGLRGIRLLRDGLPLSRADDTADPNYADPFNASYIEVYRGANALQYGGATLGGAINLVSPTGYTHAQRQIRVEGGSDGYLRAQARAGQVFDNGMDAFLAVTRFETDGSRDNAEQRISRLYANLGYRYSATSEGRFHINLEDHVQQIPSAITLAQLRKDPAASDRIGLVAGGQLNTGPRSNLAYQHKWLLDGEDTLALGAYYASTRFELTGAAAHFRWDASDYGLTLRHDMHGELDGHKNQFIWGANASAGRNRNGTYGPLFAESMVIAPGGDQYEDIYSRRTTIELFAENRYFATSTVALVAGAQAVWARRSTRIDVLNNVYLPTPPTYQLQPYFEPQDTSENYRSISPKLGVLWNVTPSAQLFANLSRSFEPPSSLEFYTHQAGILKPQRATTLEIGSRGGDNSLNWEVAGYRSQVKDALFSVETFPNSGRYIEGNVSRSLYTGLELALRGNWPLPFAPGALDWGVAYTWSHFRMDNAAAFGNNAIPGIAPHSARLDLVYRHPSGVYVGPNIELASNWYVDQANTIKAPGYGIVNVTLGYADPNGRYLLFLDARNLADKRYAATTNYTVNAKGTDVAAYNPGLPRSLYVGAQLTW